MRKETNERVINTKEICDQVAESQQLIQLSRQDTTTTLEQTQLPDDRFNSRPFFDPAATSFSK